MWVLGLNLGLAAPFLPGAQEKCGHVDTHSQVPMVPSSIWVHRILGTTASVPEPVSDPAISYPGKHRLGPLFQTVLCPLEQFAGGVCATQ